MIGEYEADPTSTLKKFLWRLARLASETFVGLALLTILVSMIGHLFGEDASSWSLIAIQCWIFGKLIMAEWASKE